MSNSDQKLIPDLLEQQSKARDVYKSLLQKKRLIPQVTPNPQNIQTSPVTSSIPPSSSLRSLVVNQVVTPVDTQPGIAKVDVLIPVDRENRLSIMVNDQFTDPLLEEAGDVKVEYVDTSMQTDPIEEPKSPPASPVTLVAPISPVSHVTLATPVSVSSEGAKKGILAKQFRFNPIVEFSDATISPLDLGAMSVIDQDNLTAYNTDRNSEYTTIEITHEPFEDDEVMQTISRIVSSSHCSSNISQSDTSDYSESETDNETEECSSQLGKFVTRRSKKVQYQETKVVSDPKDKEEIQRLTQDMQNLCQQHEKTTHQLSLMKESHQSLSLKYNDLAEQYQSIRLESEDIINDNYKRITALIKENQILYHELEKNRKSV